MAGGALPPLGAAMRAQWQNLVADLEQRESAYALESVLQGGDVRRGPAARP